MNPEKKLFSCFGPIVSTVSGSISSYKALAKQHNHMNQETKLFPYFQPIVGAASGIIIGYEALARQHDANGRVISAGELFSSPDIAADQLIAWDRMVRRQALEQFSQSNYHGYLTINISAAWIDQISDRSRRLRY